MTAPERVQVTQADIDAAAIQWCGEKDRETSLDDICYFKANWESLPGLRSRVQAFARHRHTADACIRPGEHAVVSDNNGTTVCSAYEALEDAKDEICELKLRLLGRHTATADALEAMREAREALAVAANRLLALSATALADGRNSTASKIEQWKGETIAVHTRLTAAIATLEGDTK